MWAPYGDSLRLAGGPVKLIPRVLPFGSMIGCRDRCHQRREQTHFYEFHDFPFPPLYQSASKKHPNRCYFAKLSPNGVRLMTAAAAMACSDDQNASTAPSH
jgi:hypothetical protein